MQLSRVTSAPASTAPVAPRETAAAARHALETARTAISMYPGTTAPPRDHALQTSMWSAKRAIDLLGPLADQAPDAPIGNVITDVRDGIAAVQRVAGTVQPHYIPAGKAIREARGEFAAAIAALTEAFELGK